MKDGLGSFWEVASLNVWILKGIKRAKTAYFCRFWGVFRQNSQIYANFWNCKTKDFSLKILSLTPSFVGDAIAPAANNRYSVPYESSYPSQLCTILRISNAKSCIFFVVIHLWFFPNASRKGRLGRDWGVKLGRKSPVKGADHIGLSPILFAEIPWNNAYRRWK